MKIKFVKYFLNIIVLSIVAININNPIKTRNNHLEVVKILNYDNNAFEMF